MRLRSERGLTLTELTVVMVLASLVMVGLVAFYFNSQQTWVDASTQAITQREATILVKDITDRTRQASRAIVAPVPDTLHNTLWLFRAGESTAFQMYWWNATDSLVHQGPDQSQDRGPLVSSRVERFQLGMEGDSLVRITLLQLRSANGSRIRMSSTIAMYNH